MPVTVEAEVYNRIVAFITNSGIPFPSWYVGIASKPRDRLFIEHLVSETEGIWIIKDARLEEIARDVEESLIETHGTQGRPGRGKGSPTYVYAYVVTDITLQPRDHFSLI